MIKKAVNSFEDLDVYQKLFELHLEIHQMTLLFPAFERFELGSQLRRSSDSIGANLAEGWNNKHVNVYIEGINRALGELRETRHHLTVEKLLGRYDECGRMLRGLEKSMEAKRSGSPTSQVLRPTSSK